MLGFVDFPGEALPFLGSNRGVEGSGEEGKERALWLVCKMNLKIKIKNVICPVSNTSKGIHLLEGLIFCTTCE